MMKEKLQNKSKIIISLILLFIIGSTVFVFANTVDSSDTTEKTITPAEFIAGLTEGYNRQKYLVEKESDRKFIIRPEAEQVGTKDEFIELYFRSVTVANGKLDDSVHIVMYDNNGAVVENGESGKNGSMIKKEMTKEGILVKIDISWLQPKKKGIYKLKLGDLEFIDIELTQVRAAPFIQANLTNYPEYGDLYPDKIYYIKEEVTPDQYGSFLIRNADDDKTRVRYRTEMSQSVSDYIGEISFMSNNGISTMGSIKDDWIGSIENNVSDQSTWETYWQIGSGTNIPNDVRVELGLLEKRGEMKLRIMRVVARNYGAKAATAKSYFIVIDDQEPEIMALDENGTEKTVKDFGEYESRNPQLKISIRDDVSGIKSKEDLVIRVIPLPAGKSKDNLPHSSEFEMAKQMDVIELTDMDESGKQIATFRDYDGFDEGEYALMITAIDQAGNSSDDDKGASADNGIDGPYIFYLNINQSDPDISSVWINDTDIEVESHESALHAVSADELKFNFRVSGTEDLIYGIRYIGEEGIADDTEWFVTLADEISYVTHEENTDFLNNLGTNNRFKDGEGAKNGVYEIFIIGDEEGIDKNNLNQIKAELINGKNGFVSDQIANSSLDQSSIIGKILMNSKVGKRIYEKFKIVVDGIPPEYEIGTLKYSSSYNAQENEYITLVDGELHETTQSNHVFQMKIRNSSEIKNNKVIVYFKNKGGYIRTVNSDHVIGDPNDPDLHVVKFSTNSLPTGIYDMDIVVTDEVGNTNNMVFSEILEVVLLAGDGRISFSNLFSGYSYNLNEASSIEIILNGNVEPQKSLRISVKGRPIFENGKIVNTQWEKTQGEKYREDNYYVDEEGNLRDYYNEDNFDDHGFDVFTFNEMKRIVIFARNPSSIIGDLEIKVETVDDKGGNVTNSIKLTVLDDRHGFGFGRLLIK